MLRRSAPHQSLGEQFHIEGEAGVYRVVRLSGKADALMLEPIS
jgi:hypothetical protein